MAINPNENIAQLLVDAIRKKNADKTDFCSLLNQKSDKDSGENTALHIAAGNVNVTKAFIEKLKEANAKIPNLAGDTPFHVAAKSTNPEAIMYMLKTFAPSKGGWDIDDLERDRKAPRLLSTCATRGNAEAEALLIQQGADLSKGVLHEIVIESVKCSTEKTKQLPAVYRAIVANVVTWRCLEENIKLKTKGSQMYNEFMRETMMWLITRPVEPHGDLIECAMKYGASKILHEILNTREVFRLDIDRQTALFDVTGFTEATKGNYKTPPKTSDSKQLGRNFTQQFKLSSSYLRKLVTDYDDKWRDTEILEWQPIKELTKPYIRFVQKWYCILGVIQLIYMISFSYLYIPTTCSLIELFNVNATTSICGSTAYNSTSYRSTGISVSDPSWLWLVWPVMLCIRYAIRFLPDMFWMSIACCVQLKAKLCRYRPNSVTRAAATRWPTKFLMAVGQMFTAVSFCTSIFIWYAQHVDRTSHFIYVEATSMVLLFGWITNFFLFSGMTQKFCVFILMLKEIIIKEIAMSFLAVFLFTVIGFSFAIHVLRILEFPRDDVVYLGGTVYDVFAAALGTGEYYQTARAERALAGIYFDLFEVVVVCYICVTAIILLNVLIAMMNHRYDKDERRAENFWRFRMLRIALQLELVPPVRRIFAAQLQIDSNDLDLCDCCCVYGCCYCQDYQLVTESEKQNRKFMKVHLH